MLVMVASGMKKKAKAQKRVQELKNFYRHLMVYLVINTLITSIKIIGTMFYGETFMGPIWHFSTFDTWLFWGVGLAFHAIKVFRFNPFLNKDWEERQIQKYLDKDKKERWK